MSLAQAAQAVAQVFPDVLITTPQGTRESLRAVMLAIAGQESSWNAAEHGDAVGSPNCSTCVPPDCNGYTSWGYFQVHFYSWQSYLKQVTGSDLPCDWASWLAIPVHSAQAGWYLYQVAQAQFGNGLQPWWPDVAGGYASFPHVTTSNPPYLKYLAQAKAALAALPTTTGSTGSGTSPSGTTAVSSRGGQSRTGPGPSTQTITPPIVQTLTTHPSLALGAAVVVGVGAIVAWEADWGQIRERLGRQLRHGTMSTKGD